LGGLDGGGCGIHVVLRSVEAMLPAPAWD
jgi:hypothetical protein